MEDGPNEDGPREDIIKQSNETGKNGSREDLSR